MIEINMIEINPANLIGKLHQAAADKLKQDYGNIVKDISNNGVDVKTDKKDPRSVLKEDEYVITITIKDEKYVKNVDDIRILFIDYLKQFAGNDVAKKFKNDNNAYELLKRQLNFSKKSFSIPYGIEIESGTKQPLDKSILQQIDQQNDTEEKEERKNISTDNIKSGDKNNELKISNEEMANVVDTFAKVSDVSESNPITLAAKEENYLSNEANTKKFLDSVSNMTEKSKEMTEEKMLLILKGLKNFIDTYKETDEDVKEESMLNEESAASTAEMLYNKYKKYLNASLDELSNTAKKYKYKLKDLIKRANDVKTGEKKTFWQRLADFSPNVIRQFAKEIYRWSENAIRKAKQNFKANFTLKTEKDKAQEERNKEKEINQIKDINSLREQVKALTSFVTKYGKSVPIKEKERFVAKFNSEVIDKQNKKIKKGNEEIEKRNKKNKKASEYVEPEPLLKKSFTIKEILEKAGIKTLQKFIALSKGKFIINGKEITIDKPRDENYKDIEKMFDEYPQELYAWLPENFTDAIEKAITTKITSEINAIDIKDNIDLRNKANEISNKIAELEKRNDPKEKGELIRLKSLYSDIINKKEKITIADKHIIDDAAIDIKSFHGNVTESIISSIKLNILKEHKEKMIKLSNKLVKEITSGHNVKAQKTLETILKEKLAKRIKDVLDK